MMIRRFWRRLTGADTRAAIRHLRRDTIRMRREVVELRRDFGVTLARLGVAVGLARKASAIGRNSKCPCGSGKRFKSCCMPRNGG